MKKNRVLLWLIGLPILAGLIYILVSVGISSHQLSVKRSATASVKQTAYAEQQFTQTALALTPTTAPLTDLSLACQAGNDQPVMIRGIIEPGIFVQTLPGNETFKLYSFQVENDMGRATLEYVQVCREKHFESCLRMPQPGFEREDISGYNSDGEQFDYGDSVIVSGTVRVVFDDKGNDACIISVQSIDP